MKKGYAITIMIIFTVLLLATTIDARRLEPIKIYVSMDEWTQEDLVEIYTTVDNDEGRSRVSDVRVRIMIPDLGVYYQSSEFDIKSRTVKTKTTYVDLYGAEPGDYDVFIFVSSDEEDFSRVKHRTISVW
jgi:hypothetical protein